MNPLKSAVFDFDDTLMATRRTRTKALIIGADHFGYSITRQQIAKHWGKPFDQLVAALMPGVDYDRFRNHYASVMRELPPEELPGASALLAVLTRHRVRVFVVSSGSRGLVEQDLESHGLSRYVSALWGYEDTPHHKPDPRTLDPVLLTLQETGISVSEAIYIGDSISDLHMATAKGLRFCAVLTGQHGCLDFLSLGLQPEFIVQSLNDLLDPCRWLLRRLTAHSL
jgi:phosphoglycolate phosphatase